MEFLLIHPSDTASLLIPSAAVVLGGGLLLRKALSRRPRPRKAQGFKEVMRGIAFGMVGAVFFGLVVLAAMYALAMPIAAFLPAALATLCVLVSVGLVVFGVVALMVSGKLPVWELVTDAKSFGAAFLLGFLLIAFMIGAFFALGGVASLGFFAWIASTKTSIFIAIKAWSYMVGVLSTALATFGLMDMAFD